MKTSPVGAVIVAVGGALLGVRETCINFATEGTPALLIKNNM